MDKNHLNSLIFQEILTELKIAQKERKEILLKLENLEKFLTPEIKNQINIDETTFPSENTITVDYRPLKKMLEQQQWQQADEETAKIILSLVHQEKRGYLTESDLYKLPKNELMKLDKIWLNASNNKFGFSVQNKIYQSLGGRRFFEPEIWRKFGAKVGWYNQEKWLYYEQLNFNEKAPIGHLPVMGDGLVWFVGGWEGSFNAFSILLVKLIEFNLI